MPKTNVLFRDIIFVYNFIDNEKYYFVKVKLLKNGILSSTIY